MNKAERKIKTKTICDVLEANGIAFDRTVLYGNDIIHIKPTNITEALLAVYDCKCNMADFYQEHAHKFADYPEGCVGGINAHHTSWLYPALGLAEEAGEVSGKFAKAIRDSCGRINDERKKEITKELGDVCWFVAELCTLLGVSMSEVMIGNIEKLKSRRERGKIHGSGDDR